MDPKIPPGYPHTIWKKSAMGPEGMTRFLGGELYTPLRKKKIYLSRVILYKVPRNTLHVLHSRYTFKKKINISESDSPSKNAHMDIWLGRGCS